MNAADSSAGTQQYSCNHCSSSMHSARSLPRNCSSVSGRPVFSAMRSTSPWATAFCTGTAWKLQPIGRWVEEHFAKVLGAQLEEVCEVFAILEIEFGLGLVA